jgi:hypothetical protein
VLAGTADVEIESRILYKVQNKVQNVDFFVHAVRNNPEPPVFLTLAIGFLMRWTAQ